MTKLSETQSIILSEASRHDALLASAPKLPAAARQAVFRSMLKNLLLEELPAPTEHRDLGWRQDDEGAWVALRITADGLRAIGVEPEGPSNIGIEPRELTAEEEAAELALQEDALNAENVAEAALGETMPVAAAVATAPRTGLREAATATGSGLGGAGRPGGGPGGPEGGAGRPSRGPHAWRRSQAA